MDGRRFDQLSRRLAGFGSRRQALKAVTGAVFATVTGTRSAEAQSCTAQYRSCQSDGQCCAGAVCQSGMCQPGCRIDGVFRSASTPQPGNTCARCTPAVSTTTWSPTNEGMSCWSGNLCGGASTCQAGTCQPTSPTVCQPLTVCHEAGECNPATGLCSNPPAPAGTPCGGGEMCIGGFQTPGLRCDGSGACSGGQTVPCAPYACGETACRTDCESDSHCATGAACRQSECVYLRANGESCPADHHCASGHCVEGTCCDTACDELCETCATGTCSPVVCDDGLSCTENYCSQDSGQCGLTIVDGHCLINGVCYNAGHANPAQDCETCDPVQSAIGWSLAPAGTPCGTATCDAGDIRHPQCGSGVCLPGPVTNCWPYGCDPQSLDCRTACTTGADCAGGAVCFDGACVWTIAGEITGDEAAGVCYENASYDYPVNTYLFHHGGGTLMVGVHGADSSTATLPDPYLDIHHSNFSHDDPCESLIASSDDDGCGLDAFLQLDLAAGSYVAVVTPANPEERGTYELAFGIEQAC